MPAQNELQNTQAELSSLSTGKNYIQGELIVKFKPGVQASEIQSLQADPGYSVLQSTNQLGTQLWQLNGISVEDALALYGTNPLIEYIQPNYNIVLETTIPNDPSVNQLWGLNNTGQTGGTPDADIDAPEAWDIQTGNSVVVGVIDTGVDYTHPDLINNMWTNQAEFNGSPGVDDDGNGYVDDIHGYDFVNNDGDPFDDNGHGTHVSGTIAAEGNNGIGVSGVSWSSEIMALKFLDASGSGTTFDAIEAIEYATMMGAQITNNSWGGGGYSQALYDAIAAAGAAGQLFIAAAGNNSNNNDVNPSYPASYNLDNVISVAATDSNDQLASFSNYGATSVDVAAPGVNIYSTIPGGGYASYSGTSMATPHVTGVASLIWAQDPTLTAQEVKERILATADPIAALQGKTLTGGRLNAYNALTNTEPAPGEIHGSLWNDLDSDGQWDASETPLQGWTVYLDQNQNSQLDAGELSTVSNATGNYTFQNLTPGTYTVAQVLMPGWQATYPTGFEYQWSASNQTGGPTFNWVDISNVGTALSLTDDSFSEVTLPFSFSFYGQEKNTVKISSNGYLSFGSNGTTYTNAEIPNSSVPNDLIAPFWDDLNPSAGGSVYYYYNPSEQQFIVQYQAVPRYGSGGSLTFETILDSDGSILFQYNQLNGTLNSATIGLENANGSDGVQVAYNQNYASNGLAVSFVPMPGSPQPHTVFVGSGANVTNQNFGNHLSNNVPSPLNLSFETGNFTNWNVTGNASIQTAAFGRSPTDGTYQALITNGTGAVSDAQLETALGLSAGAIDALGNGNATQGSALQFQSITVQAGDILSFDWNFLTQESTPSKFHNDFGFVAISNSSLSELADTHSSFIPFSGGFSEQTGYGTFSYQFTQAGTFNVGVGVVDVRDKFVDSGLLVDNFSITSGNSSTQGLVDSNETVEDVSQTGENTIQSRLNRILKSSESTMGDDIIHAGQSNDLMCGQGGNDKLYGEEGNDKIWGNDGDDLLWGGLGHDQLNGGKGQDTFVLAIGEGTDTIRDFKVVEDFIGLSGGLTFGQLSMTQDGQNTLISYEDETLAIVTGVNASALTQQCFTLV
ncbi:MAG TPA: S8 family serine peptidase [Chroococcales cyanobacterium]